VKNKNIDFLQIMQESRCFFVWEGLLENCGCENYRLSANNARKSMLFFVSE
jgi:hypothetical protein